MEHTCSSRLLLLRALLKRPLKATRIGEKKNTRTKTGSQSSVQGGDLTSFLSQCKQQPSQGHCDLVIHYFPLLTLEDGKNYGMVICLFHFP